MALLVALAAPLAASCLWGLASSQHGNMWMTSCIFSSCLQVFKMPQFWFRFNKTINLDASWGLRSLLKSHHLALARALVVALAASLAATSIWRLATKLHNCAGIMCSSSAFLFVDLTQVFAVRHVDEVGARFGCKCGYSRVLGPLSGISFLNTSSERCLILKFNNLFLICIVPAPCCTAAVNLQTVPFVCIWPASIWRKKHK